jgi:hypothetical protein
MGRRNAADQCASPEALAMDRDDRCDHCRPDTAMMVVVLPLLIAAGTRDRPGGLLPHGRKLALPARGRLRFGVLRRRGRRDRHEADLEAERAPDLLKRLGGRIRDAALDLGDLTGRQFEKLCELGLR